MRQHKSCAHKWYSLKHTQHDTYDMIEGWFGCETATLFFVNTLLDNPSLPVSLSHAVGVESEGFVTKESKNHEQLIPWQDAN